MSKTSEYVTLGHPDKVVDYISEYCLDRIIEQDPNVRYAVEVQIKDNIVTYGGEITTSASLFFDKWIKEAVAEIGYTHEYAERWDGQTLDASKLKINGHISTQSPDIEQGVDAGGWGDQGIFFGFHCGDTYTGDGWDYFLAKKLGQRLYYLAKDTNFNFGLDIKTQVNVSERHSRPVVEKIIIAIPMINDCDEEKRDLAEYVDQFIEENAALKSENFELVINGTGRYFTHASVGDCGTTGRKLVVDFYGGNSRVGGGSPWTKDGTKADLALNIFAKDLARDYYIRHQTNVNIEHVETELSCEIGGTSVLAVIKAFDFNGNKIDQIEKKAEVTPEILIPKYRLNKPIYAEMCERGLFQPTIFF